MDFAQFSYFNPKHSFLIRLNAFYYTVLKFGRVFSYTRLFVLCTSPVYCKFFFSGSTETAQAAEILAEQMVEEVQVLPVSVAPAVTTAAVAGGFQDMPPLTTVTTGFQDMPPLTTISTMSTPPLHSSTPDVVSMFPHLPVVYSGPSVTPTSGPVTRALQFTPTPTPLTMATPAPPPVSQIYAPPTMPAPSPSLPDTFTPCSADILQPPTTSVAGQVPLSLPDYSMPPPPLSVFGAPVASQGVFGNVLSSTMYTPASQTATISTPQAPRLDRYQPGQNNRR